MTDRRPPFRPSFEGFEPRRLLSTAHHPVAFTGTIRGLLKEPAPQPPGGVALETYGVVKAGGTLAFYGSAGVLDGSALDHYVLIGLGGVNIAVSNRQTIDLEISSHGRDEVGLELIGPVVPGGTALQAGRYDVTVYSPDATKILATRIATLTIPKGLPQHVGQTEPFAITFKVGGPA